MTGSELKAARERLGLRPVDLAVELGLPVNAYSDLEARSDRPIPKRYADHVGFSVARLDQEEALAASGLPACEELERLLATDTPDSFNAQVRLGERLGKHVGGCTTCQAREAFIARRFPDAPRPPMPFWVRAMGQIGDFVGRQPRWAGPVIWAALAFAALAILRGLFMLPAIVRDPRNVGILLLGILAAAASGAFGGLIYSFAGRPLRRIKVVGPYLAGIVTVAGYLLGIGTVMGLSGDRELTSDPMTSFIILLVLSVVLGSILGYQMRDANSAADDGAPHTVG